MISFRKAYPKENASKLYSFSKVWQKRVRGYYMAKYDKINDLLEPKVAEFVVKYIKAKEGKTVPASRLGKYVKIEQQIYAGQSFRVLRTLTAQAEETFSAKMRMTIADIVQ